jgi:hypothetical protein
MSTDTIVVFANSVKHGQHCVAGKKLSDRQWIRPVSNESGAELSHKQAQYRNPYGVFNVKPLQKIAMGFERPVPLVHQPENYLINDDIWEQRYSISQDNIEDYEDSPNNLWGVGGRVAHNDIEMSHVIIRQSLYLIRVDQLKLFIEASKKRRASFVYNGDAYELPVTDPGFSSFYNGEKQPFGMICISLGEEFNGYCYKLVATIF